MEENTKTPSAEELLRKIQELEKLQSHLKQKISKLMLSGNQKKPEHQWSNSSYGELKLRFMEPLDMKLTESQFLNIIQSMDQAVHIYGLNLRIIFWNRAAEKLYGYTSAEAYGKTPTELVVESKDGSLSDYLLERTVNGETWSGEFPIKSKKGERFVIIATNSPFRNENRGLIGGMCVSSASSPYHVRSHIDSQQPLQTSIASKISNLVSISKVKMKMNMGDNYTDHEASTPRGHIQSPFVDLFSKSTVEHFTRKLKIDSGYESENKSGIYKIFSSKADAWMGKKGSSWSQKGNERVESFDPIFGRFGWQRLDINQEHEPCPKISSCVSSKQDFQLLENTNKSNNKIEASGLWFSSLHVSRSTTSSSSSSMSIKSNAIIKEERETDSEILWEDLIMGEQIGQGSCGTVYRALWYGSALAKLRNLGAQAHGMHVHILLKGNFSDVAIKLFEYQEYPDDLMVSFKQEVSLMKKLRHPNILLFMGCVTSPPHLSIVTEFLPRGSLFRILQRNTTRLDWKRRLHMAMDIARGMNYLHHCKPPIIHRDLKSSNLLVDKNWTVKVGDFGLSRVKHHTYLKTKSGRGTPQWMAPEILCNEQADEKSDVYSYGVVLWEITTEKIPWNDLNPMQVIGAVGFMNRRLEIPKDVDPLWVSLMESCWCSEPQSRPTFQEILNKLKDLQKKYVVEHRRKEP
ncbi:uncharacterized protein LOC111911928 isoform X1 [Lactuca sativa]|uniref:non-specific serine/threonine protein kinase n=1 Tax=Lactuca sativa TaxID=4236 RepID=A0A9R1WNX1_LACSA|nr:uncharacterized protein LOC111911928 isoform X1 [Lactuca sativa]XP_023763457.1 uncharacterized protein LOC111911928 isoform X1 [Lactuca sativa]XP_023763459.1 uncharacterized protein LOC111911928 isoform X1 [Lactuca sativa]XP_023763460.1 uncharacterized protein LOC111911928 isoform X1 [Lactuca sativa]KAJ0226107.1 hypothetical protein LSAT_V11C100017370 [Lactuca sativa]